MIAYQLLNISSSRLGSLVRRTENNERAGNVCEEKTHCETNQIIIRTSE